jgi:hypothetical protein
MSNKNKKQNNIINTPTQIAINLKKYNKLIKLAKFEIKAWKKFLLHCETQIKLSKK